MLLLSRQEVRQLDQFAIDTVGISGAVLMENAGRAITDEISRHLSGLDGKSVGIVAGHGNNGGDGFVVARHIIIRGGKATVFLVAPEQKIAGDAATNLAVFRALGGIICDATGDRLKCLGEALSSFDLLVDAIGGTGITGPLRGDLAGAVRRINSAAKPIVAIDIPTGLDCDTGQATDPTVQAAMTVTMVARKLGFDQPGASDFTGEVRVVDVGVPVETVISLQAGRQ